ncbi:MAG: hypothetical protein QOH63_1453 [Acidobacteriota bacterium]|jgi:hypothetical protein|nr:hypothetical protein [Acidobacteriota bacterium]
MTQGFRRRHGQKVAHEAPTTTTAPARLPKPQSDEILSWEEVNRTHRIRNGVYQRKGRLISLLTDFGRINPCYPDRVAESDDTIYYTGNGRRGDQYLNPGNRALLSAIESGHSVPLFNKLSVGRWQHMGFWRVAEGRQIFDEQENRMLWQFTLKRVTSDE